MLERELSAPEVEPQRGVRVVAGRRSGGCANSAGGVYVSAAAGNAASASAIITARDFIVLPF